MISLEWVSEYIDIKNENEFELAKKVTEAGINVEKVTTNHIPNLVIGEIITCTEHENSDHLHVCKVKINDKETLQIVCGAPNARTGIKVIVALVGAILPGSIKIKKSKIRGIESNGMLCALYELGLEEKNDITYAKGICELDKNAPIGEDPLKYLHLDNTLYELDIHKHRNNDCYYHIGFAYELSAILNKKVTLPQNNYKEIEDKTSNYLNLKVNTDKCSYYKAKLVKNIKIGESPDFIKRRLIASGMRSINNVVDISNYVMLEYGQPLHFFDYDKLGNSINVRCATNNEEIITLDGIKRSLNEEDIVISNKNEAVCIAGVMGGIDTEVTNTTKNIVIESAIFDPVSIRYTSKKLNLISEASIRYGKGLNYEYTDMAMDRACYLLEKYANATILTDTITYDNINKEDKIIKFKKEEVNKILGIEISSKDMMLELERIGFPYTYKNETFTVTVPKRRLDIEPYVNDIAEEIGRLYGYQNLQSTMPIVNIKRGRYIGEVKERKIISKRLRSLGLTEVKNYTLTSNKMANMFKYRNKEQLSLPKPMSIDKSILRTSLIPSLLNSYEYNHKRGITDISIYEISKTYDASYKEESLVAGLMHGNYLSDGYNKKIQVDFYTIKGIVENILNYLGFKNRYSFDIINVSDMHPGISCNIILDKKVIGIMGRISPSICPDEVYAFEFSMDALMIGTKPLKYKEANKYPSINRDISVIADNNIQAENIMKIIKKNGGRYLKNIHIFDVYKDKKINNKKSLAFSLEFYDEKMTLKDITINDTMDKIINNLNNMDGITVRDK